MCFAGFGLVGFVDAEVEVDNVVGVLRVVATGVVAVCTGVFGATGKGCGPK